MQTYHEFLQARVSTIDYQINLLLERKRQMLEAENRQKRDEELKEKAQIEERKKQIQLDYERLYGICVIEFDTS